MTHCHQDTGYSEVSAPEALALALGAALTETRNAANVHIMVTGVVKTGAGWKATVNVIAEPKAEMPSDTDSKPKRKKEAEQLKIIARKTDEKEESKEKEKRRHHLEEQYALVQELQHRKKEKRLAEREFVHLYMDVVAEESFREIAPRFEFSSVHVLDGQLWEEAKKHAPDMALYRATHANKNHKKELESPPIHPKPGKNYELTLTEDLENY